MMEAAATITKTITKGRARRSGFVDDLCEMIRGSSGMVFMDCQALNSVETSDLRKMVRPTQTKLRVVKNRLMRIACEREKVSGCVEWLKFNTAVAFMGEDPLPALKVIADYAKVHEKLKLKGALIDGRALKLDELKQLAALPGKREMLGMAANVMKAPLTRAVRSFSGVYVKMALLLKEAAKKVKA